MIVLWSNQHADCATPFFFLAIWPIKGQHLSGSGDHRGHVSGNSQIQTSSDPNGSFLVISDLDDGEAQLGSLSPIVIGVGATASSAKMSGQAAVRSKGPIRVRRNAVR